MSLLLTSGKKNAEKPPRDGLCCYCSKALKGSKAQGGPQREDSGSKKSWSGPARSSDSANVTRPTPKPLKPAPSKSYSGGSVNHPSASSSKPKLSPKPSSVYPERFGSENWSTNKLTPKITPNTITPYYSSGAGDRAKTPWSYQAPVNPPPSTNIGNVPLNQNHPYPSGSDSVFQYHTDPSLTVGLVAGRRFLGNFPNHGTYAGPSQRPVINIPSKGSAFRPYKNRQGENGEFEGDNNKRALASRGKKRLSPEDSEVPTAMKPPKRRELDWMIEPESQMKKEIKEHFLFTDFSCLEISNVDRADLDLSLHL